MIYKVSEVVKELGVSRQTVYKKLRRDNFKKYIVEVKGVTGITEEGLQLLKGVEHKEIEEVDCKEDCKAEDTKSISSLQQNLINNLNKQVLQLEQQLNIKDIQIKEKDKQIAELIKLTENSQVLQKIILSNTEIKLLAYREELEIRRQETKKDQGGILTKLKSYLKTKD